MKRGNFNVVGFKVVLSLVRKDPWHLVLVKEGLFEFVAY